MQTKNDFLDGVRLPACGICGARHLSCEPCAKPVQFVQAASAMTAHDHMRAAIKLCGRNTNKLGGLLSDMLNEGFTWSSTERGGMYWSDVSLRLRQIMGKS